MLDSFKTQLFTWGMLSSSFKEVAFTFIAFQGIEMLSKYIPKFIQRKDTLTIKNNHVNEETVKTASIEFHYYLNNEDSLIESILDYICKQNNTVFLRYSGNFKPSNDQPFTITDHIDCLIKEINYSMDGKLMSFIFEIYSEILTLEELHSWIARICKEYELEKKNQLGNKKYFFKEKPMPPLKTDRGEYIWNTSGSHIKFSMTPFSTNKSLENIFGEDIPEIKKRVDLFMNHPEWYESKGIPHTLGLLLYGEPGTGKSSCIKAIAKDTNRHIIQVSLAEYTTQDQLNNLFFTEKIEVVADGQTHFYNIPLDERIYIFEDIDCLSSIVEKREHNNNNNNNGNMLKDMYTSQSQSQSKDNSKAITLNYLLNLFDGILESPNRLLIMTTNHRDKLDPALIRPGRIDIDIQFGNMSKYELKRMFEMYYNSKSGEDENDIYIFSDEVDHQLTPARVSQIMGSYYDNKEKGYYAILQDVKDQKIRREQELKRLEQELKEQELKQVKEEELKRLREYEIKKRQQELSNNNVISEESEEEIGNNNEPTFDLDSEGVEMLQELMKS